MELRQSLRAIYREEQILFGEPMSAHTTFRLGGPADYFVCPDSAEQLTQTLALDAPLLVIGNGSNLIVRDKGFRGVAVCTSALSRIEVEGSLLRAQAGALLPQLAQRAMQHSLCGLECLSGIPGSVGGAVTMNAGAYGGSVSDVLKRARVLLDGVDQWIDAAELELGYRASRILREGGIVIEAEFALAEGDPTEIKARMDDLNGRRRDKQPLAQPSAGSTFKRPEGHFAGALIEGAGLKGLTVGRAQVSPKHAGFIVNLGGASAADVLELIELVQQRVLAHSGVMLKCEVRVVGEE